METQTKPLLETVLEEAGSERGSMRSIEQGTAFKGDQKKRVLLNIDLTGAVNAGENDTRNGESPVVTDGPHGDNTARDVNSPSAVAGDGHPGDGRDSKQGDPQHPGWTSVTPDSVSRQGQYRTRRNKRSFGISKAQLEYYLPRRNFFNSHDKILKDAGYEVNDGNKNRKKPDWRKIYRLHSFVEAENALLERRAEDAAEKKLDEEKPEDLLETTDIPGLQENVTTSVQVHPDKETTGKPKKTGKQRGALQMNEKFYKPLLDYLRCVHENPQEYMQLSKYIPHTKDYLHPNGMVRLARLFRRGHHGMARDNIFIHAVSSLKPKLSETAGRQGGKAGKDTVHAVSKQEAGDPTSNQEEGRTELEKLKFKAEKWMRTLTTQELLRAKELALSDIGQEDFNYTHWWVALKTCRYLRQPMDMAEINQQIQQLAS